jgi:hypothetical protein
MKTHLVICNEADYLQAHLTTIVSGSRRGSPVFHEFKQRVSSMWRKWVMAANADLTSRSIHLPRLRATASPRDLPPAGASHCVRGKVEAGEAGW